MSVESMNDVSEPATANDTEIINTKKKKGVLSRLWGALFRVRGDDFEKRLEHITKEEAAVLRRITRRSNSWRRIARHIIIFSAFCEIIAVFYAIMTTRSLNLNWKMRAYRVLPMFLMPALSIITYSAFRGYTRMCDRKDKKTLENLRAERQAKIDELKEKTNYYITQQLIQRYDPDPAAKAAAATVLASKLGADSGLKVYVGDESKSNTAPTGKSNDMEVASNSGLRNRKPPHSKTTDMEIESLRHYEGVIPNEGSVGSDVMQQQRQLIVEHHPQTILNGQDGGWIARLAALLVGEDPTQSYALICGNCHMHNGLARKEDFPYITYYCPHCNALNRPKQLEENVPSASPIIASLAPAEGAEIKPVSAEGAEIKPVAAEGAEIKPVADSSVSPRTSENSSPEHLDPNSEED